MRVELVSHLPKGSVSGIGRYVRELHRHLTDKVDVTVTHVVDPPLARRFPILHNFPVGVDGHQPGSIVHYAQIMGCAQMLWRPVRPAVATVHDLGVLVCKEDEVLFNRLDRRILDLHLAGLRRMDHCVVHSNFTKHSLVKHLGIPQESISVVPTWIDVNHFQPVPRCRQIVAERFGLDLDDGIPSLVYVGSELPRKNLGMLLKAMATLKARNRHVRLLKIGSAGGERWRAAFESEIARLGLSRDVIFMGVVSEEDLPVLISAADICVTTTLLESTFAWVALSAMACGRPSIVTSTALVPEEAQDAVVVVSPGNVDELAQAFEALLDDPDRRQRMGKAGRRNIMAYRGDSMIKGLLHIYARFG